MMADAYADLGKNADALEYYKKAGHYFEQDEYNSADKRYIYYCGKHSF